MFYLFVESDFQLEFSRTQHEIFADNGARLASLLGGRKLNLPDAQCNGAPE